MLITVTRLNGKRMTVNALLIESVEETPDTMITLVTGKKLMVLEPAHEIAKLTTVFLQQIGLVKGTIQSVQSEGS